MDTAIQHQIRLIVTKGLNQPWSMAFLPDGGILVTERPGRLRIVRNGVLDPTPVAGLPQVQAAGLAGLMDLALHPQFAENKLVYFTYHKPQVPGPGGLVAGPAGGRGPAPPAGVITLARARWDGAALVEAKDLFSAIPSGNASRIAFGKDGNIYMTVGYGDTPVGNPDPAGAPPQDRMSLAGKVLRLNDDGTVPPDNPFVGRSNSRPEIFTLGHRNTLGLAVHPDTGAIWETENGPNGGDEINVLLPGKNYGWPVVSYGRFYLGPRVNNHAWQEGMEDPLVFWVPAIATSGLTFYTGDRLPAVEGQRLRRRHAPGRGAALRPSRAHRLQRQVGGTAPRVDVLGAAPAHPRRAPGSRRPALRADGRERRRADSDRARACGGQYEVVRPSGLQSVCGPEGPHYF